ncbi:MULTISPECIES: CaiB/BaiF CoA-transferase family protein [unclassified Massilia]|uniref:CaiB/BaiF CoA transferase family protein n=1 Tax=unclassified Massilia TaxID=2609279 RepID=UPI0017844AC8|nr:MULTISPECIES: CoA transferase [unclassified Massilia]MBD8532943.1 CoA transferase [Massilia sp. CFBP 13647]MBD8676294.1 CoA transferase [Massilia sp. CFBP 13721]
MKNPLDGMLVIELGTVLTAPLAGQMLADLGARVIKVEHPNGGDPFRRHAGKLYSPHFASYNRNKESIQLDLQGEAGKADLLRLLAQADVLLENYRPGVMARLGLTDARLRELNPRLVWCSITGFGATGPYRDRPCYDAVALGLSGLASQMLDPAEPSMNGPTISDNITGMYAAYGILGALMGRATSGEGARVEVNMLEASIAFSPEGFAQFTRLGVTPKPQTRVAISQSYAFPCADGRLLTVHLSSVDKFWQAFVAVLERPDLLDDARFASAELRTRNYALLYEEAATTFRSRGREEWCARLAEHDVPSAPVYTVPEVMQDEQVRQAGTFYEVAHPEHGALVGIHRPVTIDGARGPATRAAPTLGEHSEAIRREFELNGLG